MEEKEFNLIYEPWIRVLNEECQIEEVSLLDAIIHAHEYTDLSGELATQDVAVLRLILAVLHTVFSRVDVNGEDFPLEEEEDAYERWKELWDAGRFPEKPIKEYLEKWKERFWLFHPERPFGQVAGMDYGISFEATKLNGEILESNNPRSYRLFSGMLLDSAKEMNYNQAARWLVYTNGFDDNSGCKPKGKGELLDTGDGSPGIGWLGKIGIVLVKGKNLFETLMLNLILVQIHRDDMIPEKEKPMWENDRIPKYQRKRISAPDNLAELYTLQSRRIFLKRVGRKVCGFWSLGGDFFDEDEAMIEPMTMWKSNNKPKMHDVSKQIWREFSSIMIEEKNDDFICREPGVVMWIKKLIERNYILHSFLFHIEIVSIQYDDKKYSVSNVHSDFLKLNRDFFCDMKTNWQVYVKSEIKKCDRLAEIVGQFAESLYFSSGGDVEKDGKLKKEKKDRATLAREQLYDRLDSPFRKWLRSIDTKDLEHREEKRMEWSKIAKKIGYIYADELVSEVGGSAYTGKTITKEKLKKHYSVPKALNEFQIALNRLYPKVKGGD